nr:tail fiber domain-containing protein [Jiulongibacter sediminis]
MGYSTSASGDYSTAMGRSTTATGSFSTSMGRSTIASGDYSTAMGYYTSASGNYSTAMGRSTIASGVYSTAMGYYTSASGNYSTAMGQYATASGYNSTAIGTRVSANGRQGSFVIGDYITYSEASTLSADAQDRFLARFNNGYKLYTNQDLSSSSIGLMALHNANSWSSISDSTKKENFIPADGEKVLKSISKMRVGTWNYIGQSPQEYRHWGPMAQDFYAHFGKDEFGSVGCDTLIASADFDGVNFAAIKALEERTRELQKENDSLKSLMSKQKDQINELMQLKELLTKEHQEALQNSK